MSRVHSTVITISQIIFVAGKTLESLKFRITTNLLRYSSKHENGEQIAGLHFCELIAKLIAYALTSMPCAFCVDWIFSVVIAKTIKYRDEKIYGVVQVVPKFA